MGILKEKLKILLKNQGISPSKGLGQNFLVDQGAIKRMVSAIGALKTDTVVEIGPGLGVLTEELLKSAKRVVAVEKDPHMVKILEEEYGFDKNLELVNADVLKWTSREKDYILAGNIPFYLTAPVIRRFLEAENRPREIILVIQKEVAQRICAKPPEMSILAVSVQVYAETKIMSYIKKDSFWPRPKIDSAIIRITPRANAGENVNIEEFFKIVKAGFSHPRKQILNNLAKGLKLDKEKIRSWLAENNLDPTQRAETLSLGDWLRLSSTKT
jgi:16S rRNA (adenine1518-N6/adenine1519-N6)-dimethyltransferase